MIPKLGCAPTGGHGKADMMHGSALQADHASAGKKCKNPSALFQSILCFCAAALSGT